MIGRLPPMELGPRARDLRARLCAQRQEPPKVQEPAAAVWRPETCGEFAAVTNLAAVTCFFNPAGYRRPVENYRRFAAGVESAGVPLWTVELSFGREFDLPEGPRTLRLTADPACSQLWQKERLLNWLIGQLPADVDAVAWLDCDLLLVRPDWPAAVCEALTRWQVVQPFESCQSADESGKLSASKQSCGWAWQHCPENVYNHDKCHPGFAWAARADWLREFGLMDFLVVGNGDTWMLPAFVGHGLPRSEWLLNHRLIRAVLDWAQPLGERIGGYFGYVPGSIVHLYHGSRADRKYVERYSYLTDDSFDPAADLSDEGGVWRWSDSVLATKPRMVQRVADYFAERREDG